MNSQYKRYLESDHWKELRASALAFYDGKCCLCGLEHESNDVHHVVYRKLYNVTVLDLRVLCRTHHDEVHFALEAAPPQLHLILDPREKWYRTRLLMESQRATPSECLPITPGSDHRINRKDFKRLCALFKA